MKEQLSEETRLYAVEKAVFKALTDRLYDFRIQHGYKDNAAALRDLRKYKNNSMSALIRATIRWEKWQKSR